MDRYRSNLCTRVLCSLWLQKREEKKRAEAEEKLRTVQHELEAKAREVQHLNAQLKEERDRAEHAARQLREVLAGAQGHGRPLSSWQQPHGNPAQAPPNSLAASPRTGLSARTRKGQDASPWATPGVGGSTGPGFHGEATPGGSVAHQTPANSLPTPLALNTQTPHQTFHTPLTSFHTPASPGQRRGARGGDSREGEPMAYGKASTLGRLRSYSRRQLERLDLDSLSSYSSVPGEGAGLGLGPEGAGAGAPATPSSFSKMMQKLSGTVKELEVAKEERQREKKEKESVMLLLEASIKDSDELRGRNQSLQERLRE